MKSLSTHPPKLRFGAKAGFAIDNSFSDRRIFEAGFVGRRPTLPAEAPFRSEGGASPSQTRFQIEGFWKRASSGEARKKIFHFQQFIPFECEKGASTKSFVGRGLLLQTRFFIFTDVHFPGRDAPKLNSYKKKVCALFVLSHHMRNLRKIPSYVVCLHRPMCGWASVYRLYI